MMRLSGSVKLYWLCGLGFTAGVAEALPGRTRRGAARRPAGASFWARASSAAWAAGSRPADFPGVAGPRAPHRPADPGVLGIFRRIQSLCRGLQFLDFGAQPRLFLLLRP